MPYNNPDNQRWVCECDKKASQDIYGPRVYAQFIGVQDNFVDASFRLFNVHGSYMHGSTISEASCMKMGIKCFYKKESV